MMDIQPDHIAQSLEMAWRDAHDPVTPEQAAGEWRNIGWRLHGIRMLLAVVVGIDHETRRELDQAIDLLDAIAIERYRSAREDAWLAEAP